ncbi:phytanoyl-CoA dioxygenase family protein [Shewanella sp. 10N.7]|uniref:phytanoyl-CoA dioxygenase family protein n=1 Tax=Shewanella sp. 10N.7 TaxID=2885093 RepID=UPI001E50C7E2|nr:phytanoyl-CoA dioxygenase family protein [Shewanella sp. 10N.7]MCC4832688.1 phytanoyl-CoA dioxygenase family protein [Shewanella sp. 10N.7]
MNSYIDSFQKDGYVILPNMISEQQCAHFRSLLEKDYLNYSDLYANATSSKGELSDKSTEKVVFNLHNKSLDWFSLFEHETVLSILDVVLKEGSYNNAEPYYLNNISARSPAQGDTKQQMHIDSGLPGVNYCLKANVIWLLDDFTIENGATRIIPGSHMWTEFPPNGEPQHEVEYVTAPQGSVLIFNANLWHGGGPNYTASSRWALLLGYARWFIKPSFDFMKNTPENIVDKMTIEQKQLLGFHLIPPKDEFTRLRRVASIPETPQSYELPLSKS